MTEKEKSLRLLSLQYEFSDEGDENLGIGNCETNEVCNLKAVRNGGNRATV